MGTLSKQIFFPQATRDQPWGTKVEFLARELRGGGGGGKGVTTLAP